MKKFLTIAAILLVVGFVVARNKQMCSYVCTGWKSLTKQMQPSFSPEFEIERLKGEIAKLDDEKGDVINKMAAWYKLEVEPSKANLAKTQKDLKDFEPRLLDFAKAVKSNGSAEFVFNKVTFIPAKANEKLAKDFTYYNTLKATVKTQQELAVAKEKRYQMWQEYLTNLVQTKREAELKLTQLETELLVLKNSKAETDTTSFDNGRMELIQKGLKELEKQIGIAKKAKEIEDVHVGKAPAPPVATTPQINPDVVLDAILNPASEKNTVPTTEVEP